MRAHAPARCDLLGRRFRVHVRRCMSSRPFFSQSVDNMDADAGIDIHTCSIVQRNLILAAPQGEKYRGKRIVATFPALLSAYSSDQDTTCRKRQMPEQPRSK